LNKCANRRLSRREATDSALRAVDWTFETRERPYAIESLHPYPAKFIGELPRALISCLTCPKDKLILDPFVGSGTTLVEAQRAGYKSVGVDLNPIACLIARVKTGKALPNLAEKARAVASDALRTRARTASADWAIPNVDHWFKPEVQDAVRAILEAVSREEHTATRDALRLCLSAILVRVSNQESDTRYAAVIKRVTRSMVLDNFVAAADKVLNALAQRAWKLPHSKIIQGNTLALRPSNLRDRVGLVVTSPPYPNAYEYWLYHKYRMWWLGFDPLAVKEQEIGARAHFFKKDGHTAAHFREQMSATFDLIDLALIRGGYSCFVIGRSKIHGQIIDNAKTIQLVAEQHGHALVSRIERPIASHRKAFNLTHAKITTESILVFQRS
jgi:hypothetical protein